MKRYFTKYFPSDLAKTNPDTYMYLIGGNWLLYGEFKTELLYDAEEIKQGELLLCDRNMNIGDIVHDIYLNQYTYRAGLELGLFSQYKIVGSVSKGAVWVGSNCQFDEDDIEKGGGCILYYGENDAWSKIKDNYYKEIKLRCPTCKTYH